MKKVIFTTMSLIAVTAFSPSVFAQGNDRTLCIIYDNSNQQGASTSITTPVNGSASRNLNSFNNRASSYTVITNGDPANSRQTGRMRLYNQTNLRGLLFTATAFVDDDGTDIVNGNINSNNNDRASSIQCTTI